VEKSGGVVEGEGECGDDVVWLLSRDRRSLDILSVKKEAKLSASEIPGSVPPHSQRICYLSTPQEIHLRQRSAL